MAVVALIGTLDTKGTEYAWLVKQLEQHGAQALLVDVGSFSSSPMADISADEVIAAAGEDAAALRERRDRGEMMRVMSRGAAHIVRGLAESGRIHGLLSLGGLGGSSVAAGAMQALPVGFPKLLVSTMASGDVKPYVGEVDATLMYSVVDVAGINSISSQVFGNAAAAIAGMALAYEHRLGSAAEEHKPLVAITMFGVTTPAADEARAALVSEVERRATLVTELEAQAETTQAERDLSERILTRSGAALAGAEVLKDAARAASAKARLALERHRDRTERDQLTARAERAEELDRRSRAARAALAANPVDEAAADRLAGLATELRIAEDSRALAAATVAVRPLGPQVHLDGHPLDPGTETLRPVLTDTRLEVPGVVEVEIRPGATPSEVEERVNRARADLETALAEAGVSSECRRLEKAPSAEPRPPAHLSTPGGI